MVDRVTELEFAHKSQSISLSFYKKKLSAVTK